LQQVHGLSAAATAGYAVLPLLLGGVGSIVSGWIPLSVPRRWVAISGFIGTGVLILIIPGVQDVRVAMGLMALASFSSDLTMPISWNTCVEIGKQYTATVASTMNMLGNFAGFVAPVLGGIILDHTNNNWNAVLYTMGVAAFVSAACWLFIDPDKSRA
jgi:MFS family permease